MSKKTIFIGVFFAYVALLSLFLVLDTKLHVIFCNVDQGDAILIWRRSQQLLIDTGPPSSVQACLWENMPVWDRKIEKVVITHADADHSGSLAGLVKAYKIDQIITNEHSINDQELIPALEAAKKKTIDIVTVSAGDSFGFLGGSFEVLWPENIKDGRGVQEMNKRIDESTKNNLLTDGVGSDDNSHSLVIRLKFGGFSGLFLGDIGFPEEQELISSARILPVTFLKIAHHGSKNSTSKKFLALLQAKIAVISVGEHNPYHHPAPGVLERLVNQDISIFRTDIDGEIELVTDGNEYRVK